MKDEPISAFVCGPSKGKCICKCPESCDHVWDGPVVGDGAGMETVTCSRCGMWSYNHDAWL